MGDALRTRTAKQRRVHARTETAADPDNSSGALGNVLEYLSGDDGNPQLYSTAARGLHLTSKQYQAAARATLRHLRLDRFHEAIAAANAQGGEAPALPWDLLAACPAVTSWALHPQQLEAVGPDVLEQLSVAACRLKQLQVVATIGGDGSNEQPRAQLQGLGRLLRVCGQLEALEVDIGEQQEWLLLDPDSTSISSVTGPSLPHLHKWKSSGVSGALLGHWVAQQQQQQQQQLGSSLQELSLAYNRSQQNISGLTALASLVALDLTKCGIHSASLTALTHLTSLTRLGLYGGEEEAKAACGVTGLRELQLYNSSSSSSSSDPAPAQANPLQELPSSLSCLKQLSHLNISGCEQMVELPADLGVWLPRLEVLEAKGCQLAAVPASLTALQRLVMSGSTATSLALPAALSGIRALDISNSRGMTSLVGLSDVTALQHLDLSSTLAVEGSLDVLQPLTRLRHLAFTRECYLAAASFTVLGTLTHLTHLTIGPPTIRFGRCMTTGKPFPKDPCLQALATMPPLPHLEQLTLSQGLAYDGLGAAGPWLAQLTALTQLSLRRMYPMRSHKYACAQLQRLPVTLKELDLSVTPFEEPPSCLTRLTALEVLRIGMDGRLMDLTRWRAQAQAQGRASGSGSGSKKGRKRGG